METQIRKERFAALKTKIADLAIWEEGFNKRLANLDNEIKDLFERVKANGEALERLKNEVK